MSDDLLTRLDNCAGPIFAEAAHRIRELESACYRLTEERDRLKGWADKYHDEVLELRARVETAEADALERAAEAVDELSCRLPLYGIEEIDDVTDECAGIALAQASEKIRSLKPKASE